MCMSARVAAFLGIQQSNPCRAWKFMALCSRDGGSLRSLMQSLQALIAVGAKIVDQMNTWRRFAFPTLASFSFKVSVIFLSMKHIETATQSSRV